MRDDERAGFENGLGVMCGMFQVSALLPGVVDAYWQELKPFTQAQFSAACRRLMQTYKKRYSTDFPLPVDFIAAMQAEPQAHGPYERFSCSVCGGDGLLYAWIEIKRGLRYAAKGEVIVERSPNSPSFVTRLGDPRPESEADLTPCVIRCECPAGVQQPHGIPLRSAVHLD